VEGLHIFSQTEIVSLPSWYFWVVFGVGILFMVIGGLMADKSRNNIVIWIGIIMLSLAQTGILFFGAGWQLWQQPTGKYTYTVSIDNTKVNLLEFNSKYEILKQDGELWTIKDK
jgi:hypothetical protein